MQARTKGDNRRSGRTTRMLAAAIASVYKGGTAHVVLPRGMWENIVPTLKDLGASRIASAPRFADFGEGSRLYFLTIDNPSVDRSNLSLRGIKDEAVFWDHEAVRQMYNPILMKYHEYD